MWKCVGTANGQVRMYTGTCSIFFHHCVLALWYIRLTPIFFKGPWSGHLLQTWFLSPLQPLDKPYFPSSWKFYYTLLVEATSRRGQISPLWSIFEWCARVVRQWETLLSYQARQTLSGWRILAVLMHFTLRRIKNTNTLQVFVQFSTEVWQPNYLD